jgi:valyl-tRNA synthetase
VGREPVTPLADIEPSRLTRADRWILARLDMAIAECDDALGPARPDARGRWAEAERFLGLRLNEYAEAARRFVWNELADWYVESTKGRLTGSDAADRGVARAVLTHCFDQALRLLHPIVPFITEALWQRIPGRVPDEFLARAPWPVLRTGDAGTTDVRVAEFDLVRAAVDALRRVRSDYAVAPSTWIDAVAVGEDGVRTVFEQEATLIGRLARARLTVADAAPAAGAAHVVVARGAELVVPLGGIVDVERECAKLTKELADLDKQLGALRGRLGNDGFVSRAPAHVVEAERQKERDWTARREQLAAKVTTLCGGR